ncbi:hypothetical protein CPC08DRAFT_708154 [Agrocybe pediades]|nr:hypothetical protein CPC08DRAFT_708154 [Agrocybe pediades]
MREACPRPQPPSQSEEVEDSYHLQRQPGHYTSNKPRLGHYLLDIMHKMLDALRWRHKHLRVRLRWVPGHMKVDGNEEADAAARKAAEGDCTSTTGLPPVFSDMPRLFHSKAAAKQQINEALRLRGQAVWRGSPRFA